MMRVLMLASVALQIYGCSLSSVDVTAMPVCCSMQ